MSLTVQGADTDHSFQTSGVGRHFVGPPASFNAELWGTPALSSSRRCGLDMKVFEAGLWPNELHAPGMFGSRAGGGVGGRV